MKDELFGSQLGRQKSGPIEAGASGTCGKGVAAVAPHSLNRLALHECWRSLEHSEELVACRSENVSATREELSSRRLDARPVLRSRSSFTDSCGNAVFATGH